MGVWDAIFRRGKKGKRHGRGAPSADEEGNYTRQIARPVEDAFEPAAAEPAGAWGGSSDPWDPTQIRQAPSAEPSPPPRPPAPPPRDPTPPRPMAAPRPPARGGTPVPEADDATVLGVTKTAVAAGRVVAVLVGVEGPLLNHVHSIYEGENVLGRGDPPERLPDETRSISREHAMLLEAGRDFMLQPLKPENLTFLNDQPVEGNQLVSDGDRIRLGAARPSTFVFRTVP